MITNARITKLLACVAISLSAAGYAACTDDSGVHDTPILKDAGPLPGTDGSMTNPDGSPIDMRDGAPPPGLDCFPDPKTHDEIINACTDAARVDKHPTLPLLLADGGLPPLP